jgi:hypothetical protein
MVATVANRNAVRDSFNNSGRVQPAESRVRHAAPESKAVVRTQPRQRGTSFLNALLQALSALSV